MTLRPLTMADADFLLMLKNMPETRKFAIATHEEIKREDHLKWLESNIQYFKIIEALDGRSMGAIREQNNEVSIWISKEHWGGGIASYFLELIAYKEMTCKVVNGNIGSFRAFINAGFKPIDYKENYYILKR